jgi:hypothetical protein
MPGKAAYFEKPILVSDGFLMGGRVRLYGIGLSVPQGDVHAMLNGLEQLSANPVQKEKFAAYRAAFSEQTVGESLEHFLEHVTVF